MAKSSIAAVLAALLLSACGTPPSSPAVPVPKGQIEVINDPMNTQVMVFGPKVEQPQGMLSGRTFTLQLLAGVDKKTGRAVYLVRHEISHSSTRWIFFNSGIYLDASGEPQTGQNWRRERGDVSYCTGGTCRYTEAGVFSVPAQQLSAISTSVNPADAKGWRIRLTGESGYLDGHIPLEAIRPVLARVESLQLGLAQSAVEKLVK